MQTIAATFAFENYFFAKKKKYPFQQKNKANLVKRNS